VGRGAGAGARAGRGRGAAQVRGQRVRGLLAAERQLAASLWRHSRR
jgi:hypothetical protein